MNIGLLQEGNSFETLTRVSEKYFHPEDHYSMFEEIEREARHPEEKQPPWLRKFKFEAKEYLLGNTDGFDLEDFSRRVQFHDGSPAMFLRRAWAQVFPDDAIPGFPIEPFDSIYTIAHIYFGSPNVEAEEYYVHPDHLRLQFEHSDDQRSPLLRSVKPDLTRMLSGDLEGLDLVRFRGETSSFYFHLRKDDLDFARYVWQYLFQDEPHYPSD